MSRQINWGILGLGKIAHKFAEDLRLSDDAVLYAVGSRDLDKAAAFASKHHCAKFHGSYEALASDPGIDVVYIATPHALHLENTLLCLENGKAVLCEKPMGMDREEVRRMVDTARRNKLFLMEGMWTRFIPAIGKYLELLQEKAIGEIISLHADFGFKAPYDVDSRIFNKGLGGGALMDIGIYPIFLSLITLGSPSEIKAMARMAGTNVDSYCAMLFSYENSAKAVLEATFETATPTEATIYGTAGRIKLQRRFHHTETLTIYRGDNSESVNIPYRGHGYLPEIGEVNQCLREGRTESPKLPLDVSMELISIIDRVKPEIGLRY